MANIELFDEYTARTFASLYESFPRKKVIDAREICGHSETDEFGSVLNRAGERSKHFEVAMATIEWLIETGYIRAAEMDQYGARDAVLTSQGLMVLKASPDSLKPVEGIGDRIARLVHNGSIDAAKEAANAAIALGIGTLFK